MNLRELDKTSHVAPLLVKLYDSHQFYGLVKTDRQKARAELARAASDLFETDLTEKEQELLADILIGLMRQAEKDLRQALAERLATLQNVPLRLILHLANDDIAVASPVLRMSLALSDLDLVYIIKSQGPAYWQAIAARDSLSDEIVDILADTRDVPTAIVLSRNDRIRLTRHALNIFTEMAKQHDDVAKPLLMRPEVPEDLARRLYRYVGEDLREYISAFFGINEHTLREQADSLIVAFAEATPASEFMPTEKMLDTAHELRALNMLSMDVLMETIGKGDVAGFIAQFAAYTDISARKIHDFLRQSCPKGMAIACRAFRVQRNDFVKIYLLTHRMRSGHRMINQKDMLDLLGYFDKIRPEAAARIIARSA